MYDAAKKKTNHMYGICTKSNNKTVPRRTHAIITLELFMSITTSFAALPTFWICTNTQREHHYLLFRVIMTPFFRIFYFTLTFLFPYIFFPKEK